MSNFHPDIGLLIFVTSNRIFRKMEKKLQKAFFFGKENHRPYENIFFSFIVTSKYLVKHVFLIHSHISNLDPKLRLYLIHVEGIDQSRA